MSHTSPEPRITVIDFDRERHEVVQIDDVERLSAYRDSETVSWIDVQGLGNASTIEALGRIFSIHPLALEDAVNTPVRPKSEVYENHHLVVSRMARMEEGKLVKEQVTLVIGPRYVITFQELYGDVFEPVRRRTQKGPRMRRMGPDYLAYALIDTVIDSFFPVLESYGDRLETLENDILERPQEELVSQVFVARRELLSLRRSMLPQREAVSAMLRDESSFISEEILPYLRDCQDHAVQITDVLQSYLDLAGHLADLYMSMMGNKMNEVMKVLTIMASIFIPLTFLAGIYGMNFERMPELRWPWAYPTLLAVMFVLVLAMVVFFRRRGWMGGGPRRAR